LEKLWEYLYASSEKWEQRQAEFDREIKETNRIVRETAKLVKSNGKQIGKAHPRSGVP